MSALKRQSILETLLQMQRLLLLHLLQKQAQTNQLHVLHYLLHRLHKQQA
jgi:hypothetical protein